jgi:LEA14-like dessication related protein
MYLRTIRIALIVISALLFSCSTLQQLVLPPTVKIENVNIAGFSFEDVTLDFTLLIQNPNAFGVGLEGYNYSFAVQGKQFLSANENQRIEITAAGNSTVLIPLTLNFKKLYQLMAETKSLDSLSYQLTGSFHPSGLLSAFTIPFSRSGSLPNVRIPDISFSGLTVDKMGFTGVDLRVGIKLTNKNIFGFDIGKFNYDIALAGNAVAKGSTTQLASVPAKGATEISLPILLNFAGALGSLTSLRALLNGDDVSCSILGDAELKTPFGPLNLPFNTTQVIPVIK